MLGRTSKPRMDRHKVQKVRGLQTFGAMSTTEYVSGIHKRVINPNALVRGASRDVSCNIATVIKDERRRICSLGVLHLWLIGVFTCASARRRGSLLSKE